mgnify:CR=1 FL=1
MALLAAGATLASAILVAWHTSRAPSLEAPELKPFKVYFLGWVVEYSSDSKATYYGMHEKFTWVSPVWYTIDSEGRVVELAYDEALVERSREWGVKVLPLVSNEGFRGDICHKIFSPGVRERVVDELLHIVLERGYDGINIDFEGVYPEDRDGLVAFMRELYRAFKRHGKIVSIDVPAKTRDVRSGWAGAYDYGRLANYTDLFIVMIYDYHWAGSKPGPISPLSWFERVLDYTLSVVPREKVVAGIPFYGYDWPPEGRATPLTYRDAINLAKQYNAEVRFDPEAGEATFTYVTGDGRHVVWFNVAESTKLRIETAVERGVYKIAAWRVGQEDPRTWDLITRP